MAPANRNRFNHWERSLLKSRRLHSESPAKADSPFLKKMEDHADAEAFRLRKPTHGKLRLIGSAIGVAIVVLLAIWMAYHQ